MSIEEVIVKIEMGESLLYSWLRHAKECQIVQTNWTTSPNWHLYNQDIIENLMAKSSAMFADRGIDVFKQSSLPQLLKQAEIDVMGISLDPGGHRQIYAVDVAFHECGLNYGSKTETAARIMKKYLRSAFCIIGYLGLFEGELIFASPKVIPSTQTVVEECLKCLNTFFQMESPGFSARLLANDDFDERVLRPILLTSEGISDTNELFLRSYQLFEMFEPKTHDGKGALERPNGVSHASATSLSEIKIGRFAQLTMSDILLNQLISKQEVERLCDPDYSRSVFGLPYAMLRKLGIGEDPDVAARDHNMYRRYYSKLFSYDGDRYLLTNQWFERNRPAFEEWIREKTPGYLAERG